jgi:hypothetical protein
LWIYLVAITPETGIGEPTARAGFRVGSDDLFAYLGDDDVSVLCTRARAYSWLRIEGGLHRSCIRRNGIDGLIIYTQFQHFSSEPDVPMFWK